MPRATRHRVADLHADARRLFVISASASRTATGTRLGITAPTGFAPKGYAEKADGSPDSNNAIAWDGKLKADATFKPDDGVEHTLTVFKTDTDANTTMAHLLADVKAAITASTALSGKIDARVIAKSGATSDRIELTLAPRPAVSSCAISASARRPRETMGLAPDTLEMSQKPALAVANNASATMDYSPTGDVKFSIGLDGAAPVQITVATATMSDNTNIVGLLADLNTAIAATGLNGKVKAIRMASATSSSSSLPTARGR